MHKRLILKCSCEKCARLYKPIFLHFKNICYLKSGMYLITAELSFIKSRILFHLPNQFSCQRMFKGLLFVCLNISFCWEWFFTDDQAEEKEEVQESVTLEACRNLATQRFLIGRNRLT